MKHNNENPRGWADPLPPTESSGSEVRSNGASEAMGPKAGLETRGPSRESLRKRRVLVPRKALLRIVASLVGFLAVSLVIPAATKQWRTARRSWP
jgi:hypothetical protein